MLTRLVLRPERHLRLGGPALSQGDPLTFGAGSVPYDSFNDLEALLGSYDDRLRLATSRTLTGTIAHQAQEVRCTDQEDFVLKRLLC